VKFVHRRDHVGEEPGLDVSERARLRELERGSPVRPIDLYSWGAVDRPGGKAAALAGQRITATKNTRDSTGVVTSTPTSYIYGGTGQAELLSQATTGGDTYRYTYGRADSNGVPEIESLSL